MGINAAIEVLGDQPPRSIGVLVSEGFIVALTVHGGRLLVNRVAAGRPVAHVAKELSADHRRRLVMPRPVCNEPRPDPGWRWRVLVPVRRGVRNLATPAELNYVEPRTSSPQPQLWGA